MQNLRSALVEPYFDIPWDDEKTFRIRAGKAEIDRFRANYKKWADRFKDPADVDDVEVCREALEFLAGKEIGDEIFDLCMADLRAKDPQLTDEDCIYQLTPILTMIADAWVEHVASMDFERSERVRKYMAKVSSPDAL